MEKFIVVRGLAANDRNAIDKLDNICNVVDDYSQAEADALEYIERGSRSAQIYRLEAELSVETVMRVKDGIKDTLKLTDK